MDEIADLKADLGKRLAEPVAVSHKVNVCIMNMYALSTLTSSVLSRLARSFCSCWLFLLLS